MLFPQTVQRLNFVFACHLWCTDSGYEVELVKPPNDIQEMWPDVQPVPLACGAIASRALFLKQMGQTGARTWLDLGEDDYDALVDTSALAGSHVHLRIYILGTDQGGDQQGCHKEMLKDFDGLPLVWYFRQWCLHHQLHLISKRQMVKTSVAQPQIRST